MVVGMKRLGWVLPSLALGACSFPTESFTLSTGDDVPTVIDTGPADTGSGEDRPPVDTGSGDDVWQDAGPEDTGPADTGPEDAGPGDAGEDVWSPTDAGTDVPTVSCRAGFTACGTECVDTLVSEAHCGRCDLPCSDLAYCQNGACVSLRGSYAFAAPTSTFVEACMLAGATTILGGQDDGSVDAMLPFDATYWGRGYPTSSLVTISTNGWLSFDREASRFGTRFETPIPSRAAPNGVIAPLMLDLVMRPGICIGRDGAAPRRRWIVQWDNARYYVDPSSTANVSFEAILHESSGDIEFLYQSIPAYPADAGVARTVTVGIESQSGVQGIVQCSAAPAGTCSGVGTNARIRFQYTP